MLKKVLFLLVVTVALLAFAGSGVPTASAACSGATNCNPMFGPNFNTTQTVGAGTNPTVVSNVNTEDAQTEIGETNELPPPPPAPDCFAGQPGNHGCP